MVGYALEKAEIGSCHGLHSVYELLHMFTSRFSAMLYIALYMHIF